MKSIRKPIVTGVMITSLLLTSLTGCGTSSASGNAEGSSQDNSSDTSTSSENTFAFTEASDMELTSTTIVGRVTGISDNTISLDIADLSDIEFPGPGQRPESEGNSTTDGQSESEQTPPEKPEDGAAPEKPEEGQAPEEPGSDDQKRPDGRKDFSLDLDSLTYVAGTLTIEDESMLLTATQRTLMSLFRGGDRQKGNIGEASNMPDLGSASGSSDSSDSESSDQESTDNFAQDPSDSSAEKGDEFHDGQMPEEETEEPVSLSDITEGSLILITFDENGTITAIHVITDTDFLTQDQTSAQDQSDPQ
ncbi:MAG: hypothetical protein ACI4CC_07070 [Lachnospiraceae bacterium]